MKQRLTLAAFSKLDGPQSGERVKGEILERGGRIVGYVFKPNGEQFVKARIPERKVVKP